jgi:hypothetical protein
MILIKAIVKGLSSRSNRAETTHAPEIFASYYPRGPLVLHCQHLARGMKDSIAADIVVEKEPSSVCFLIHFALSFGRFRVSRSGEDDSN